MAEADEIIAVGRNKNIIEVGDVVKYVNSDTVSRVTDIKPGGKKEEREFTADELEERFKKASEILQGFELGKAGGGGAGG